MCFLNYLLLLKRAVSAEHAVFMDSGMAHYWYIMWPVISIPSAEKHTLSKNIAALLSSPRSATTFSIKRAEKVFCRKFVERVCFLSLKLVC
jgi:hypothetical protein